MRHPSHNSHPPEPGRSLPDAHTAQSSAAHVHSHGLSHHHAALETSGGITRVLTASLAATLGLVVVEVASGFAAHSVALLSDAAHNMMDVPMLVISWLAVRWALRAPTQEKTYGYHRAGILAAFVNAMVILFVAGFIILESAVRLRHPEPVRSSVMLWVALVALAVNGGITLAVHHGREDLNVRTVWIHNLGDALSNVAIFAAALAIRWWHALWADPLIGVGIGAAVIWTAAGILRESSHILLEGMPRHLRLGEVAQAVLRVSGVQEVHDIHIWTLGPSLNAISCHVRIPDMHMEESEKILADIRRVLAADFQISHSTIQFERAGLPSEAGLFMPAPAQSKR